MTDQADREERLKYEARVWFADSVHNIAEHLCRLTGKVLRLQYVHMSHGKPHVERVLLVGLIDGVDELRGWLIRTRDQFDKDNPR